MKFRIIVVLPLFFSSSVLAKECKVKYLEELQYTDIECQFYMGTAAYRNKDFSLAAYYWTYVTNSPLKFEGDKQIKAMALSTVNFLTYEGLGLKQDRVKAVKNWEHAVTNGDLEARRHLGAAYSDEKFENKNHIKALGWYESIFLLHPDKDQVDESDIGVYEDAVDGAVKLRLLLSSKEIEDAVSFAESTINQK